MDYGYREMKHFCKLLLLMTTVPIVAHYFNLTKKFTAQLKSEIDFDLSQKRRKR